VCAADPNDRAGNTSWSGRAGSPRTNRAPNAEKRIKPDAMFVGNVGFNDPAGQDHHLKSSEHHYILLVQTVSSAVRLPP